MTAAVIFRGYLSVMPSPASPVSWMAYRKPIAAVPHGGDSFYNGWFGLEIDRRKNLRNFIEKTQEKEKQF